MKPIVKHDEIPNQPFLHCHDGNGTLFCRSLLDDYGKTDLALMHYDEIPNGVTIGVHTHEENEEVYFLLSGSGILSFDGVDYEMKPGDISLCGRGHSHGFAAKEDCILIVVGSK